MKFTRTIVVNSENPRTDPAFVPKYLSRTYDDNFDSPRVDFDLFFINFHEGLNVSTLKSIRTNFALSSNFTQGSLLLIYQTLRTL